MRQKFTYILLAAFMTSSFGHPGAVAASARKKRALKLLKWIDVNPVGVGIGQAGAVELNGNSIGGDASDGQLSDLLKNLQRNSGAADQGSGGQGNGLGDAGSATLKFDDAAAKGSASGEASSGDSVGDRKGEPPGGNSGDGPQNKAQIFEKYWPVCMFFDPSVSNAQANEIVKGSVEKAAACRVNLYVVPITINANYPDGDEAEFNKRQKQSCNMQSLGVSTASTMLVNRNPEAAAMMCGVKDPETGKWDRNVAGCAQLREGGGIDPEQMKQMKGSMAGGAPAKDGIIPSVIVPPAGWNSGVASHEFMGHSQMGWPNYDGPGQEDAGLGIGTPKKGGGSASFIAPDGDNPFVVLARASEKPPVAAGSEGAGIDGEGWKSIGCQQMFKMAHPNDKRVAYDPNQQVYMTIETDPAKQWKLGEPLWGNVPPSGPPPSTPPPNLIADRSPESPLQDQRLFFDDKAAKGAASSEGADGRHKKKNGAPGGSENGDVDRLLTSLRKSARRGASADDSENSRNQAPAKAGGGDSGSSLTFDDSVKKSGDAAVGVPPSIGGSTKQSNGSSASGGSLTFNDNATKGGDATGSTGGPGGASRGLASPSLSSDFFGAGSSPTKSDLQKPESDDGFFKSIAKAEQKRGRRVKGSTLRANQERTSGETSDRTINFNNQSAEAQTSTRRR